MTFHCLRVYWLTMALAFACCGVNAQLIVDQTVVSFQPSAVGSASQIVKVHLTSEAQDGGPVIQALKWKQGNVFIASPSRSLPTEIFRSKPLEISLTFGPTVYGKFTDVLEVEYRQGGSGTRTVTISVSGDALCLQAEDDCEPIRPVCSINKNQELWVEQEIPSLKETVFDSLITHLRAHKDAVSTYALPGSYFYEVLGLSKLFDVPNQCCACGGANCLSAIEFTKVKGQPTVAQFRWPIGSPKTIKSVANPYQVEVDISLPTEIRGKAIVRASSIEYVFSNLARPSMEYRFKGKTWFSGPMNCIAPGAEVVVRHGNPTNNVPSKHLIFTSTP